MAALVVDRKQSCVAEEETFDRGSTVHVVVGPVTCTGAAWAWVDPSSSVADPAVAVAQTSCVAGLASSAGAFAWGLERSSSEAVPAWADRASSEVDRA